MTPTINALKPATAMAAAFAAVFTATAKVSYTAHYTDDIPFDGTPDNGAWRDIGWSTTLVRRSDGKTPDKTTTRFKACYTADAVYVAVECAEPNIAGLADEHQAHEFWLCDVVELFSTAIKNEQIHLICSARGNLNQEIPGTTDVRTRSHVDWSAKAKIGADRWTCCFRIPFLLFGKTPTDGPVTVRFNVCRNATTTKELSCWSQAKSFKNEADFGMLTLSAAPAKASEAIRRAADPSLIPETPAEREKREKTAAIMKALFEEE